ncbi:transglycosylase [Deltaproteobacteria bacterium Smac51]|nr:transglycosylase [Deltaproteobacteria bacterium Smac51]
MRIVAAIILAFGCLAGLDAPFASAGAILSESVTLGQREAESITRPGQAPAPKPSENRLASIDVYSLSPGAKMLRQGRMVPAALVMSVSRGEASFPDWGDMIKAVSVEFGLDPSLVAAVIKVESNFNVAAVSPAGAQGLMQIMPETGQYLGLDDPFDPEANIRAGARYLKEQLEAFSSVEMALAAYNAGPGNVLKHGGMPPFRETQNFVSQVVRHWNGYR